MFSVQIHDKHQHFWVLIYKRTCSRHSHSIRHFTSLKYRLNSHDRHAQQTQKTHEVKFSRLVHYSSPEASGSEPSPHTHSPHQVAGVHRQPLALFCSCDPIAHDYFLSIHRKSTTSLWDPLRISMLDCKLIYTINYHVNVNYILIDHSCLKLTACMVFYY